MPTKTQPRVPPTLRPSSRADLERKRKGVLATGPSGAVYRIRKVNLARHAEAGGMTAQLRRAAVEAMTKGGGTPEGTIAQLDPDVLQEMLEQEREVSDRLVLATVIEPKLTPEDLGGDDLEDDPVLPAVDYEWLLAVAQGKRVQDGQGRILWGPAPLDLWDVWRDAHKRHGLCSDEDCAACEEAVEIMTAPVAT